MPYRATVFARLILALLLAAFALPALASGPCHDAPAAASVTHHGARHAPKSDDRTAVHMCIGCIPPASLAVRAVAAPLPPLAPAPLPRADAFTARSGTPPALPPPRPAA